MARRETLRLSQYQSIETDRDLNGRYYIAYSGGCSIFYRDTKELLKFLKIPKSIPMRASLDSWLASLAEADAQRKSAKAPVGLSAEHLATGFGPEAHADEEDPTANTKMIT